MSNIKNLQAQFLSQSVSNFEHDVTPPAKSYMNKMQLALGISAMAVCSIFMFSNPVQADTSNASYGAGGLNLYEEVLVSNNMGQSMVNLAGQCINAWTGHGNLQRLENNPNVQGSLNKSFDTYKQTNNKLDNLYAATQDLPLDSDLSAITQEVKSLTMVRNNQATLFLADCGRATSAGINTSVYQDGFSNSLRETDELRALYQEKTTIMDQYQSKITDAKNKQFKEFLGTLIVLGAGGLALMGFIAAPVIKNKINEFEQNSENKAKIKL